MAKLRDAASAKVTNVLINAQTVQVDFHFSDYPTYQAVTTCLDAARGVNGALFKRR